MTLAAAPLIAPVTRFLARHHRINRIVRKIPIATKFLSFFAPAELRYDPPVQKDETPHIAPVYNARARKPKGPRLG